MRVCSGWRRRLYCLPFVLFIPYFLSVLELHQSSTIEGSQKKHSKKFDHLVLGPAAGQGLHDRLQCQGTKALNKTHIATSSHESNFGESIALITVFTIYNSSLALHADGRSSDLVTVGNASYSKMERSMAILNVFINFIQATMPQSNVIILTDPASEFSLHRDRVTIYPIQGLLRNKA